ncbi:response regulator [Aureibaculum sp. A20]|uniref:histidine kinase n=1 Tax=Aureibaculum flavum TaxID=2795986 RepID=A0ABS0WNN7_9FLAO|nr:hybrid sensor histidine kinase/response regulator transcription factor [Aureibaculum flavum]MBJ2173597.1 response regulator [Aureibaculum flavum]
MLKRIYTFLLLLIFTWSGLYAQNTELEYSKKIDISDGLAHNGVTSILEDSKGYLWFGTYDGLNKYDGYHLDTYKNTLDNDILTSNRIRALSEDKNGNIWIGTDEGITIFNYSQKKFKKIYSNKLSGKGARGPIIRKIIITEENKFILAITENNGILVFNKDYSLIKNYSQPTNVTNAYVKFYNGIYLENSNYIFSTSVGLILFNSETEYFQKISDIDINHSKSIIKIDNHTVLATLFKGIAIIEFNAINNSYSFTVKEKILNTYHFNNAMLDTLGNLWLSELNEGIIHIDNIDAIIKKTPFKLTKFNDGLKILRGSGFLKTSRNSCWFATFNEGLYQFKINKNPFHSYNTDMDYDLGLQTNSITHIAPFDDNRVFLSANFGGLALFNTQNEKFEPLPFKLPKSSDLSISAVFVDSKHNTWIRINDEKALHRIKKNSKKFEKIPFPNISNPNEIAIRSFSEDKFGNIWIGTNNDVYKISINKFDVVTQVESLNTNNFFKNNELTLARYVYADPLYDYVWVGTGSDGLFRVYNEINKPIEKLEINQYIIDKTSEHSLSSNFVTSILRMPNEELWIGTEGGGICKVLKSDTKPEFIAFTEKNGLSNNVVKSISFDNENNLWVATNIGLNKFNTIDKKFKKFHKSDGLPFEDFWFAAKRMDNGIIVLSGLDGLCYFNPNEIANTEDLPLLQFENFKIYNKTIVLGDTIDGRVLLKRSLNELDEITLKHDENVFSIDLISLHYSNPANHNLKYRLLPLNKEWIEVPSGQNTIQYSGLQPGDYEFNVMASNSLDEWTIPKQLKIIIKPSIWNTKLAYFIYTLLGVLLTYIIGRGLFKIQALNYKVEIEKLAVNNVKEVNEEKLRFFSNISHEIKTPLTLISGPINILSDRFKGNADVTSKLKLMQRQSKKIQQLIDQVQDFRRADANLLKMEYSRFNFDNFILELVEDFKFLAKTDNKSLIIDGGETPIIIAADKDKLGKILNNLLNNAFKYTRTNDTITINYKSDNKDLIVTVSDTGQGIEEEDLPHVFERFYQSYKKKTEHIGGSGIGLAFSKRLVEMHYGFINAKSELGKNTIITVRLPVVKKHLASDKLEELVLPKEEEFEIDNQFIESFTPSTIEVSGEFTKSLIFYAEDNLEMRNFVSEVLSKYFIIKNFRNGQECIDAMEDEWPDLVISDVQMPELNGLELCISIKSNLKTSHIPVILLTALTNIKDHVQGIRDGADAYIKKPFNVQQLVTNVEALLTNRKQLRERYQVGIPLTKENNKNNRNDNAFLEKLYSLIEENLDNQDFNLNSLAKELYLNRTHFYQKVKVLTDKTPFELLKMYRLKKAAEFLAQKGLSVNEVYAMTGFKSRTHFTKIFKEKYNISPGKYAAETRKNHESS